MFGRKAGAILLIALMGLSGGVGAVASTSEPGPHRDLIRFHVIANSDSEADQALKLQVRDEILKFLVPVLQESASLDESRKIVKEKMDAVKAVAEAKIAAAGYSYPVKVELGRFNFPTKTYGGFSLPAGEYEAFRVVIGDGAGKNWWCVLYPPLCFVDITRGLAKPSEPLAVQAMTNPPQEEAKPAEETTPQFRFKLWDLITGS